jgi:hypothetical protein
MNKNLTWLQSLIDSLSQMDKSEIISSLGEPTNPENASLINLKPKHPDVSSIDLLNENDQIKQVTLNLKKNFGVTPKDLIQIWPEHKLEKNSFDERNEYEFLQGHVIAFSKFHNDQIYTIIINL